MTMHEILAKYLPDCFENGYLLAWLCAKFLQAFRLISLEVEPLWHLAYVVKSAVKA